MQSRFSSVFDHHTIATASTRWAEFEQAIKDTVLDTGVLLLRNDGNWRFRLCCSSPESSFTTENGFRPSYQYVFVPILDGCFFLYMQKLCVLRGRVETYSLRPIEFVV